MPKKKNTPTTPDPLNTSFRKQLMLDNLRSQMGLVTHACKKSGIDPMTYYRWLAKDAEFKRKVEDIKPTLNETAKDFAEGCLFSCMQKGAVAAIIFYLKSKAKDRGYVEKHELDLLFNGQDLTKLTDAELKSIVES